MELTPRPARDGVDKREISLTVEGGRLKDICSPFCNVSWNGENVRSNIEYQTKRPEWELPYVFDHRSVDASVITLTIVDYDNTSWAVQQGAAPPLVEAVGKGEIDLSEYLSTREATTCAMNVPIVGQDGQSKGTVKINLKVEDLPEEENDNAAGVPVILVTPIAPNNPQPYIDTHALYLTIRRGDAQFVGGHKKLYPRLGLKWRERMFYTSSKRGTQPTWSENVTLPYNPELDTAPLEFSLFNWSKTMVKGELLGSATIDLSGLEDNYGVEATVTVTNSKNEPLGEIVVTLLYKEFTEWASNKSPIGFHEG